MPLEKFNLRLLSLFLIGLCISINFSSCSTTEQLFQKQKYLKGKISSSINEIELPLTQKKHIVEFKEKIDVVVDNDTFVFQENISINGRNNINIKYNFKEYKEIIQHNEMSRLNLSNQKNKLFFTHHTSKEDRMIKTEKKEIHFFWLVLLSFIMPFLAVGLKTNWDLVEVIITFLFMFVWPVAVIYSLLIVYEII